MCYIFLILIQILSFNELCKSLCCGVRLIEPQGASHSNNFAHLTLPRKEDLIAPQLQILIHYNTDTIILNSINSMNLMCNEILDFALF